MNTFFTRFHARLWAAFHGQLDDTFVNHQRLLVYVYMWIATGFMLLANLLGTSGPQGEYYQTANACHLVLVMVGGFLFLHHKWSLYSALVWLLSVNQFFSLAEILYLFLHESAPRAELVIGNMMLFVTIFFISIIACLKVLPVIFALSSLSVMLGGYLVWGVHVMGQLLMVLSGVFLLIYALGRQMLGRLGGYEHENRQLQAEYEEILCLFDTRKESLARYVQLAKERGLNREQVEQMVKVFSLEKGQDARQNVEKNLTHWYEQRSIDYLRLDESFPLFTPSEMEIARLVMRGCKLSEICTILGKNESNITCQRSNMRAKLGLNRSDDLRTALLERARKHGDSKPLIRAF